MVEGKDGLPSASGFITSGSDTCEEISSSLVTSFCCVLTISDGSDACILSCGLGVSGSISIFCSVVETACLIRTGSAASKVGG